MMHGRVGEAARLDPHVGLDLRVAVAEGRLHVIDSGGQENEIAAAGAAQHRRPFAFPSAAVHGSALEEASFIDVEAQTVRRNDLISDAALHAQAAGGNHKRLFLRVAGELHAPRCAGEAVGGMNDVIAGIEREHRIGVLRFGDRQRTAAIGPLGENPPGHRARNIGAVGRITRGNRERDLAGCDLRNESVRIALAVGAGADGRRRGAAAARGCAGCGAGGWGVEAGGGAKLGAEPLGPVNPTWAKAPAEDKARSAKAESRATVRTDSIDAVSLPVLGRLQGRLLCTLKCRGRPGF